VSAATIGTLRRPEDRRTVEHYVRMLVATAPRAFALAVALRCGAVVADGLGILLLLPLLRFAGLTSNGTGAAVSGRGIDTFFHELGFSPPLTLALVAYALAVGTRVVLQRQSVVATMKLQEEFLLRLRTRLFRAVTGAEWRFLAACRGLELTHALTGELERVGPATYRLLNLLSAALSAGVCFAIAVRISPAMTLMALGTGGLLLAAIRGRRRAARATGQVLTDTTAELFTTAAEHMGALKTAKSHGAESRTAALFGGVSKRVAALNVQTERLHADAALIFEMGSVLALCGAVYIGVVRLHLDGATILVLLYLFSKLTPRFASLQGGAQDFLLAMPSFASVLATMRRCEQEAECTAEGRAPILRRAVTLEGVRFHYAGRDATDAVRDATLSIEAGRTTAIVGPSGAGKSTIADLLMGLLFPDGGAVRIDGVALTPERARRWRECLGYVAQDAVLFHDTIRANLLWGAPDASETDLTASLALAAADDFVARLPQGLDTVVGDRGVSLSGGERQRIALARALLRRPSLLILDEATSNVDAETEARIQGAIASLHGHTTVLVITHRLAMVRTADFIYVVDEGRVVEAGTWDLLLACGGRFAALSAAQGCTIDRPLSLSRMA
jgi:ATP-binding cassette, subfamily C, bacterial